MATDTIKACSRKVDPHRRHNTFEVTILAVNSFYRFLAMTS